jgi:hypothetical protein
LAYENKIPLKMGSEDSLALTTLLQPSTLHSPLLEEWIHRKIGVISLPNHLITGERLFILQDEFFRPILIGRLTTLDGHIIISELAYFKETAIPKYQALARLVSLMQSRKTVWALLRPNLGTILIRQGLAELTSSFVSPVTFDSGLVVVRMIPQNERTNGTLIVGHDTWSFYKVVQTNLSLNTHAVSRRELPYNDKTSFKDLSSIHDRLVVLWTDQLSVEQVNYLLKLGQRYFKSFVLLCDKPLSNSILSDNTLAPDNGSTTRQEVDPTGWNDPFSWNGHCSIAPSSNWQSNLGSLVGFIETYLRQFDGNWLKTTKDLSTGGPLVILGTLEHN